MTALGCAVALGCADTARLLLENGATMDLEDKVRRTDRIGFSIILYHRSGFDCEIPMIANCEFFRSSQSKEWQSITWNIFYYTVRGQRL